MKVMIFVCIMIALVSCSTVSKPPQPVMTNTPPEDVFVFQCENGEYYTVHYHENAAYVYHNYEFYKLPLAISASGARYSDGTNEFWNKGDMAMITINGKSYTNCKLVNPLERGKETPPLYYFWAMSNDDPKWNLSIIPDVEIVIGFEKGNTIYRFPYVQPDESRVKTSTYTTMTDEHKLSIEVIRTKCYDAKSQQYFPYVVVITFDGDVVKGCGTTME